MNEQTEQNASRPSATPPSIQLEDFIEAVTRGVSRAMAVREEVSGYALSQPETVRPPVVILAGIFPNPVPTPYDLGDSISVRR